MKRWISYFRSALYDKANSLFKYFIEVLRYMILVLRAPVSTIPKLKELNYLGWGAIIIVLFAMGGAQRLYYGQTDVDYIFYQAVLPDLLPDQLSPLYLDIQYELNLSDLSPVEQTEELRSFIFEEVDREIVTRPYETFKANHHAGWVMIALAWLTWMMIVASFLKARLLRARRINKPKYLQWFCMVGFVMSPMVLQGIWFSINALLSDGYSLANTLQPLTFSNYLPEGPLAGILGLFSVFMLWSLVLLAMLWRYVAKVSWWESALWTFILGFFMLPLSIYMGG